MKTFTQQPRVPEENAHIRQNATKLNLGQSELYQKKRYENVESQSARFGWHATGFGALLPA